MRGVLVVAVFLWSASVARAEPAPDAGPIASVRLPLLLGVESWALSALAGLGGVYAGYSVDGFSDVRSGLEETIVPVAYVLLGVPALARVWSLTGWTNGLWMGLFGLGLRALHVGTMQLVFLRSEHAFTAMVVGGLLTGVVEALVGAHFLGREPPSEPEADASDRARRRIEAAGALESE